MMRSMMAGISGLRMHQVRMDVIGNNIANVNTTGFKSSRVTFKEVFSSTMANASAPDSDRGIGGVDPMQVGMGMTLASIDLQYTEGSVERTDNPLDVSIEGDGLFVIKENSASGYTFTRAGMFGVDKIGNLVTSSGAMVCGWQKRELGDGEIEASGFDTTLQVEPINLYKDIFNGNKKLIPPEPTSNVVFNGNINSNTELDETVGIPMTLYDSYGNEHQAQLTFTRVDGEINTWEYSLELDEEPGNIVTSGQLVFHNTGDEVGKLKSMTQEGTNIANGKITQEITFNPDIENKINVEFDFSALTQYAADDSAKVYDFNGYATGELIDYSIGNDGTITGVYSNGKQQPLAMIALAAFDNPQGLKKVGESSFTQTANSGEFKAVAPDTTAGALVSNTLEMSNVDLSTEFTNMIITQRGFQANSKTISTTDEMLQELVNLKR